MAGAPERRRQKCERIEALLGKARGADDDPQLLLPLRLRTELREVMQADPERHSEIICRPIGDDILHLKCLIHGANATPFEGGVFVLDVRLPKGYPLAAPGLRFDTRVWHPNVCPKTGDICDGLFLHEWSPAMTIEKYILTVESILSDPKPGTDFGWHAKARLWTQQYAWSQCGCRSCQERVDERAVAVVMAQHPRLGQHSALATLRGAEDLLALITSFATISGPVSLGSCKAWVEEHFLGEWA